MLTEELTMATWTRTFPFQFYTEATDGNKEFAIEIVFNWIYESFVGGGIGKVEEIKCKVKS